MKKTSLDSNTTKSDTPDPKEPEVIVSNAVITFIIKSNSKSGFIGRFDKHENKFNPNMKSSGLVVGLPNDIKNLFKKDIRYTIVGDIVQLPECKFAILFPHNYNFIRQIINKEEEEDIDLTWE